MAQNKQPSSVEIKKLQQQNRQLQSQINELKSEVQESTLRKNSAWRIFVVILCAGLATVLLVVGSLLFWTGRTLVDTNKYMGVVGPLIDQPAVREAVATRATQALFENIPVEQIAQESLPPKAAFLAAPLAQQLQSFTQKEVTNILASEQFKQFWVTANREAQSRFINFLKAYEGDGTINLTDVYTRISDQLQGTSLSFLAGKQLPAKVGDIQVLQADWLPTAHNLVKNLDLYRFITITAFLVLSALTVLAVRNRRRAIIRLGLLYAGALFVTLISLRLARQIAFEQVAASYQVAAGEIWTVVTESLRVQLIGMIAIFILIAVIAWVSGPSKGAQKLKHYTDSLLAGKLHENLFGTKASGVVTWVNQYRRTLQWGIVAVTGVILLLVETTASRVFWSAVLMLILVLLVEVVAGPAKKRVRK